MEKIGQLIKDYKSGTYSAGSKFILAYHPVLGWQVSHPNSIDTQPLVDALNSL